MCILPEDPKSWISDIQEVGKRTWQPVFLTLWTQPWEPVFLAPGQSPGEDAYLPGSVAQILGPALSSQGCVFSVLCLRNLSVRMFVYHVHTYAHRGRKRALDPLGLELWIVMNHRMGAGSQIQVSGRASH